MLSSFLRLTSPHLASPLHRSSGRRRRHPERRAYSGGAAARPDVAAHGAELLALAPAMYTEPKFPNDYEPGFEIVLQHCGTLRRLANFVCRYEDLHASLNKTVNTTASPGHNCYPHRADGVGTYTVRSASQAWTVLNINRLTNH